MISGNLASIDMGTNATRLAIGAVDEDFRLQVIHTQRYPLRIGTSVFKSGHLTAENIKEITEVFGSIKKSLEGHDVKKIRAVATSAMREAKNSKAAIDSVFKHTSIKIEVISGLEEASLISWAIAEKLKLGDETHVIADLGAGSLELVKLMKRKPAWLNSFTLGTVVFAGMDCSVLEKNLPEMLEAKLDGIDKTLAGANSMIATGGNIEVLSSLLESDVGEEGVRSIRAGSLATFITQCRRMTIEEIRYYFNISHERAEVICPAAIINLWLARKLGHESITIPLVGMKEAILMDMANELSQV